MSYNFCKLPTVILCQGAVFLQKLEDIIKLKPMLQNPEVLKFGLEKMFGKKKKLMRILVMSTGYPQTGDKYDDSLR